MLAIRLQDFTASSPGRHGRPSCCGRTGGAGRASSSRSVASWAQTRPGWSATSVRSAGKAFPCA